MLCPRHLSNIHLGLISKPWRAESVMGGALRRSVARAVPLVTNTHIHCPLVIHNQRDLILNCIYLLIQHLFVPLRQTRNSFECICGLFIMCITLSSGGPFQQFLPQYFIWNKQWFLTYTLGTCIIESRGKTKSLSKVIQSLPSLPTAICFRFFQP